MKRELQINSQHHWTEAKAIRRTIKRAYCSKCHYIFRWMLKGRERVETVMKNANRWRWRKRMGTHFAKGRGAGCGDNTTKQQQQQYVLVYKRKRKKRTENKRKWRNVKCISSASISVSKCWKQTKRELKREIDGAEQCVAEKLCVLWLVFFLFAIVAQLLCIFEKQMERKTV